MREGVYHEVQRICRREAVAASGAGDAIKAFAQLLLDAHFAPGTHGHVTAACDAVLRRAEAAAARLTNGEVRTDRRGPGCSRRGSRRRAPKSSAARTGEPRRARRAPPAPQSPATAQAPRPEAHSDTGGLQPPAA